MSAASKLNLLGLDLQELTALVQTWGLPLYRGRQLFEAVYGRGRSLAEITTLPQSLRAQLAEAGYHITLPAVQHRFESGDGTVRYLIGFEDEQSVETVWMPEGDDGESGDGSEAGAEMKEAEFGRGRPSSTEPPATERAGSRERRKRATICVSSQAGCAVNCQFCLTALLGLERNLTAGEIAGQVMRVLHEQNVDARQERVNLVFMGQGEPFHNYPNFMSAVRLLVEGVGIPPSRMTVSTAGIVPRIDDFGKEAVRPKLAISLNAPEDELRSRLMPLNRKWGVRELVETARRFPLRPRERVTFEYVLIDKLNDSVEQARELAELIGGIRAKVNLIALNPGPGVPYSTPTPERVLAFQHTLTAAGIPSFVRRPRGRDIFAACGQLKRTVELSVQPAPHSSPA